MPGDLAKAKIIDVDSGEEITVMFNPEEYSIDKAVNWKDHPTPGLNAPPQEFTMGQGRTLNVKLFFDTSHNWSDVRVHTQKIYNLTLIKEDTHRPPLVKFEWGSLAFQGVITNLSQRFTMFNKSGEPVRATLDISFKECEEARVVKSSPDRSKVHTMKQGERLDAIAAREYYDPSHWKTIAEANDLEDPLAVPPGQRLNLPPLT